MTAEFLRNAGSLFLVIALAFLVALALRSPKYPTFREWWSDEGMLIWLTTSGVFSIVLLAVA